MLLIGRKDLMAEAF